MDLSIMPNMTIEEIKQLIKERAKKNTPFEQTKIAFKDKVKAIIPILKSTLGEEIPLEQQIKRLEICSDCEKLVLINDKPACGICGCELKIDNKSLINLVSKKETKDYGCKLNKWQENNC